MIGPGRGRWPLRLPLLCSIMLEMWLAFNLMGQPVDASASKLIEVFERPEPTGTSGSWAVGCGYSERDASKVSAEEALVRMGFSALPDIESALNSLDGPNGEARSTSAGSWLVLAYGRILGVAAVPRLRTLMENPSLKYLTKSIDQSIADALRLTSYVSGGRWQNSVLHQCVADGTSAVTLGAAACGPRTHEVPILEENCRPDEPRDSIDRLILGLEHGDDVLFRSSLGPRAVESLSSLLAATNWSELRSRIWHVTVDTVAVGYRFDLDDPPSGSGVPEASGVPGRFARSRYGFRVKTQFTSRSGRECGIADIDFSSAGENLSKRYFVNNPDLAVLLGLIAACASATE